LKSAIALLHAYLILSYPLKEAEELISARLVDISQQKEQRLLDFAIPRILIVLVLPENLADWLQQSEEELCLRYCAYWVSLRGMSETQNTTTVTISLPRSNQFTATALQSIMQRIGQGVEP